MFYYRHSLHAILGMKGVIILQSELGNVSHDERKLIRRTLLIAACGICAWALPAVVSASASGVVGFAQGIIICTLLLAAAYFAAVLKPRLNRTGSVCFAALIGLFAAMMLSSAAVILVYFPGGEYVNLGMKGVHLFFWLHAAAYFVAWCGVALYAHLSRKQPGGAAAQTTSE